MCDRSELWPSPRWAIRWSVTTRSRTVALSPWVAGLGRRTVAHRKAVLHSGGRLLVRFQREFRWAGCLVAAVALVAAAFLLPSSSPAQATSTTCQDISYPVTL